MRAEQSPGTTADDWLIALLSAACTFLVRMVFDSEDGGDTFLRNVSSYADYTAL
jgi:hypothetical protein